MDGWRQHGPNLIGLSEKVTPGWLAAWLKNPKSYNPETRMPDLRLADDEIADLVAYLMGRPAQPEFKSAHAPKADAGERDALVFEYLTQTRSVVDARSDLAKMSTKDKDLYVGEKIIAHYGCYACHNIPGFEKAKPIGVELSEWGNKPVHLLDFGFVHVPHTRADWFAQKVGQPRSFDREKVKTFQEKSKMPQFSLSPAEIEAVQSTVLGMQKDDMADALLARAVGARGAVEAGRRIVKDYNCQGCHVLEDKGGAIREAMTANKIDLALAPPIIRGEGAKVQSEWLFTFLHGPKTGQIRPWLKVRMPTFGFSTDQINSLTAYFATQDKARYPFDGRVESLDPRSRAAGAATFTSLKCAQCHPTSQDAFAQALKEGKTPADLAPILAAAHTRLRYDWIADWIKRPDEWMPGTRMPTNFPKVDDKSDKRVSPLAPALDTPAFAGLKKELVAIWGSEAEAKAYLGDPDRVTKALRDHVWSLGNDFQTVPQTKRATTQVASH
jgi:cytochrome c2